MLLKCSPVFLSFEAWEDVNTHIWRSYINARVRSLNSQFPCRFLVQEEDRQRLVSEQKADWGQSSVSAPDGTSADLGLTIDLH